MAAQVIPFDFESHEVRTLLINDQPWFVAMDVAKALAYSDSQAMTRKLDDDEIQNRQIVGFGNRGATVINESGLYSAILRSRKAEAKRFKKWVTAEVLPAIRKHGRYEDRNDQMTTLLGQTIGTDGFRCLGAVLDGKVRHLSKPERTRAKHHIWSQVHKAFSVVSAQDIPANHMDAARNFIAAYAIDGEYLPKQDGMQLEPKPNARYLVSFNHKGEQRVDDLPSDACVMTHQEMMKAMTTPGELPVSTDEMFEFTMAALANLKVRSWNQAQRLKHVTSN